MPAAKAVAVPRTLDQTIAWEDPPAGHPRARLDWAAILRPLKDRPNTWARVRLFASRGGASSSASMLRKHPARAGLGRWDFRAAVIDERTSAVYARYLGAGK
jgi:hypothetical protein